MSVVLFGSALIHRVDWLDADPRLLWTRCGLRMHYDPSGYQRALRVMGQTKPTTRCESCA